MKAFTWTNLGIAAGVISLAVNLSLYAQSGNVVTSVVELPLDGSFVDAASGETVNVSGAVHLVTHVVSAVDTTTITLYATLPANVNATATNGAGYLLQGETSQTLAITGSVVGDIFAVMIAYQRLVNAEFREDKKLPVPIHLNLKFASDGTLLVGGDGSYASLCSECS
jgi:hypothetical protein